MHLRQRSFPRSGIRVLASQQPGDGPSTSAPSRDWLVGADAVAKLLPSERARRQRLAALLDAAQHLRQETGFSPATSVDRAPNLRKPLYQRQPSFTAQAEARAAAARAAKRVVRCVRYCGSCSIAL